jgi:hypothetical protein
MEFLKKKWQIIVICILILFGMSKCASSCTNANKFEASEKEKTEIVNTKDSIIKVYDDSVKTLNMKVQVLEATITGNQEMINRLAKANEQISEAKKNIQVNVRQNK